LIYTVLITASPKNESIHKDALNFCLSSLANEHDIKQVFFMHDAVRVVESKLANAWAELFHQHSVQLQTCLSTAEGLGIDVASYPIGFSSDGTSSLADAILQSDKLKQFS